MVHLCIAKKVLDLRPNMIKNPPQYYLGSLAPDAVHFRPGFTPGHKKASHLCVGDERWGETTNNDAWADNIVSFLKAHRDSENIDFIYGYITHCLADLRNNIEIWSPFKLKYYGSLLMSDYGTGYDGDGSKKYHAENKYADLRVYHASPFRDELWNHLSKSKGVDLDGLVHEDELNKIRDHILYKQYKDRNIDEAFVGSYIKYQDYLSFIESTVSYITRVLGTVL
jgi:hypothetical protein